MKIKTRFAPSPTGYLHIGNVRTAFYSWLFAQNSGGKFILRIDDTDIERSTASSIDDIITSMNWLKLNWDEGPYFQSKRLYRYNEIINYMLLKKIAYKCYCSKTRLNKLREKQIEYGKKPRYDGYCYKNKIYFINKSYVVRFNNPKTGSVIFNDLIRGIIKFNNKELDDLIIQRADGTPTYNFCGVIDDLDMNITHVIRGDDHINNTPRQINILKALGAPIPYYAHVSTIIDNNGKKLSKSYNTDGIMQYRDNGFLPEAILNYLIRLGWSYNDQEIFSIKEMKKLFNLSYVNKSSSRLNIKKLLWLNQYYINNLPSEYVATYLTFQIKKYKINIYNNGPKLTDIIKILGKRYKTLKEIAYACRYFYEDIIKFDIEKHKEHLYPTVIKILQIIRIRLENLKIWTPNSIYSIIEKTTNEMKIKTKEMNMPLRIAITGSSYSPNLNVVIYLVGKLRSLSRIDYALNLIRKINKM